MIVGVVTTSFPRFEGDPAGGFVEGLSRWVGRHHDIEVVCAREDRRLFYRGGAPEALFHGPWHGRGWLGAAAFSSRLAVEVALRARRWDRIMSHWMVPCGVVAAVAARRLPHLCIAHGSDARMLAGSASGRRLAGWLAQRSELVYVAETLRVDGAPGRVAPMGVDRARLIGTPDRQNDRQNDRQDDRQDDRRSSRRRFGLSDDDLVVVWLGRLTEGKGPDLLCDALQPEIPGVVALIAGEGPFLPALQRRQDRSLRLVGQVSGAAKQALLRSADVLVVSSRVDGAPVVIAEAQACGIPVVASAVGGIPELVCHGVEGLLVPVGDREALRSAIVRLRESPSLLAELARGSAVRGRERDWDVAAPRILGSWLELPEPSTLDAHVFEVRRV